MLFKVWAHSQKLKVLPFRYLFQNVSNFRQDYNEVSTYIMYLQHMRSLQMAFDGRFVQEMNAVISQKFSWLCRINTVLRSQNNPVTQFVNSSVVSGDLEDLTSDSLSRHKVNYVLMKNANSFIRAKNAKYTRYLVARN